jgi:hypothetical protein
MHMRLSVIPSPSPVTCHLRNTEFDICAQLQIRRQTCTVYIDVQIGENVGVLFESTCLA